MPQYVRLLNTDPTPFRFHHNNIKRSVPPGGDVIVPWDLATTLFGDPFLIDGERDKERTRSLKRARGVFNYELGMESDEAFDARRPHIEVWDIETSPAERIYMLIEDPEGYYSDLAISEANAATGGREDEITMLNARISALTQQMSRMMNVLAGAPQMPQGQTVIPSSDTGPTLTQEQEAAALTNAQAFGTVQIPDENAAPEPIVLDDGTVSGAEVPGATTDAAPGSVPPPPPAPTPTPKPRGKPAQ